MVHHRTIKRSRRLRSSVPSARRTPSMAVPPTTGRLRFAEIDSDIFHISDRRQLTDHVLLSLAGKALDALTHLSNVSTEQPSCSVGDIIPVTSFLEHIGVTDPAHDLKLLRQPVHTISPPHLPPIFPHKMDHSQKTNHSESPGNLSKNTISPSTANAARCLLHLNR